MRLLIDLQGAQATHYQRGIGRYSLSLALALVRQRGTHEIRLLLNAHFAQSVEEIRAAFAGHVPDEHIHIWQGLEPFDDAHMANLPRRELAAQLRSAGIASIASVLNRPAASPAIRLPIAEVRNQTPIICPT